MGQLLFRWRCPFRLSVVVLRDSLPIATTRLYPSGSTFIIRGFNFDLLPNEVVIGWSASNAITYEVTSILFMISKSSYEATFEFREDYYPSSVHLYEFFASGFVVPRSLLQVDFI